MCAERRLSPVEPVRRLREAAGVDHAHKAPQQKRIDGAHGNILISDVIDGKYYIFFDEWSQPIVTVVPGNRSGANGDDAIELGLLLLTAASFAILPPFNKVLVADTARAAAGGGRVSGGLAARPLVGGRIAGRSTRMGHRGARRIAGRGSAVHRDRMGTTVYRQRPRWRR